MLGAEGNNPRRLAHMAVMERCVAPVRYVAEAGQRFEPENTFWRELLEGLPVVPQPKSGVLPHSFRGDDWIYPAWFRFGGGMATPSRFFGGEKNMTNAERILRTLDNYLDHEVSLVIFGRAAIALGFEDPPEATTQTLDVDGIIPLTDLLPAEAGYCPLPLQGSKAQPTAPTA